MSWGAWQQDPPTEWQADRLWEVIQDDPQSVSQGIYADYPYVRADINWQTWTQNNVSDISVNVKSAMFCTPTKGWEDLAQSNSYIEYESSPPVLVGWLMGSIGLYYSKTSQSNASFDFLLLGHISVELNYNLPIVSPGDSPYFPGEGTGDIVNVFTTPIYDINAVSNIADPGPVNSIGLFLYDPTQVTYPPSSDDPANSSLYTVNASASFNPVPLIQLPPYRYWESNGVPPMRQRHRDDGLATDARQMKGHGSSLQSSIRRGGQVYY
jgi:hypothetical protein